MFLATEFHVRWTRLAGLLLVSALGISGQARAQAGSRGRILIVSKHRRVRHGRFKGYFELKAGRPLTLKVTGPLSLSLKVGARRSESVRFVLDGRGLALTVGRRKRAFRIQVGPGTHELVVSSSGPLYIKVRRAKGRSRPGERRLTFPALVPPRGPSPEPRAVPAPRVTSSPRPVTAPRLGPAERPHPAPALASLPARPAARPAGVPPHPRPALFVSSSRASPAGDQGRGAASAAAVAGPAARVHREVTAKGHGIGLNIFLGAGAARTDQDFAPAQGAFLFQAAVGYEILKGLSVGVDYATRVHDQVYVATTPDPESLAPEKISVSEQVWDLDVSVSFDVLRNRWYQVLPMLGLKVGLAPKFYILANDVVGSWSGGFRLGLEADCDLAEGLGLRGWMGWMAPFFGDNSPDTLSGGLRHLLDYGFGARWSFAGKGPFRTWYLDLALVGEHLVLEFATRDYLGAVAGVGTSL